MACQYVALDTEFVRIDTFYPKLGLLQMFDGDQLVLVDALAIDNWDAFAAVLRNRSVVKVLHACSEDLDVFWHTLKVMPTPLFDSQVAAAIAGRSAAIGYAKLVSDMLDVDLDKGESRTDWLRRPLKQTQLAYAANDVFYLHRLYPLLLEELGARSEWVFSDAEQMIQRKQHPLPPEYHYLTIKNNWQVQGRSLAALRALAQWRINTAKRADLPVNFVIREAAILSLAKCLPQDEPSLVKLGCLSAKAVRRYGAELLDIIAQVCELDCHAFPPNIERLSELPFYKTALRAARQLCLSVAQANAIKPEVLASKKQVNQILKMHWFEHNESDITGVLPDLATGWRRELVYQQLLELVQQGATISSEKYADHCA